MHVVEHIVVNYNMYITEGHDMLLG